MTNEKIVYRNSGIGFFGLLGILFIGLKLTHMVDWSWWLVLLPLYGPSALIVSGIILFLLAVFFAALLVEITRNVFGIKGNHVSSSSKPYSEVCSSKRDNRTNMGGLYIRRKT